jgi:voltage-gated sodium channel
MATHPFDSDLPLHGRISHAWFQALSSLTVFLSFLVLMLSSYPEMQEDTQVLKEAMTWYCKIAYAIEVISVVLSHGNTPHKYFRRHFNQFDFVVLLGTLGAMPGSTDFYSVLRMMRLFTALKFLQEKLVSLRMVVGTIDRSAASISYVGLLLLAVYFQFGMIGVGAFDLNDPFHFGTIHRAMISLFRVSILDNWIELLYINQLGCDVYGYTADHRRHMCVEPRTWPKFAPVFFMTFVIIATFVMVNLFVGVVTTSMEDAHSEIEEEQEAFRKVTEAVAKFEVSGSELAMYREVYDLINTDGGPGIEAIEMEEVLRAAGVHRTMEQVAVSLREIGGEDMCIDFAEFIEYLITSDPNRVNKASLSPERIGVVKESTAHQSTEGAVAIAIDTTGDGVIDAIGYDTTGGKACSCSCSCS